MQPTAESSSRERPGARLVAAQQLGPAGAPPNNFEKPNISRGPSWQSLAWPRGILEKSGWDPAVLARR